MYAIRKDARDRDNLSRDRNALNESCIIRQRARSRQPRDAKEVERHDTAHNEDREIRFGAFEDLCEQEREDYHRHQRIQDGPEYAQ